MMPIMRGIVGRRLVGSSWSALRRRSHPRPCARAPSGGRRYAPRARAEVIAVIADCAKSALHPPRVCPPMPAPSTLRRSMTSSDSGALLERSAQLALFAERLAAVRRDRRGRLVLVSGEAGIGKTALLRAFCAAPQPVRVLWGGCDALHTPRALGPFVDIAEQAGERARGRPRPGERTPTAVASALAAELRRAARDPRARGPALGRRGDARRHPPARTAHRAGARARARDLAHRRARPLRTRCASRSASCPPTPSSALRSRRSASAPVAELASRDRRRRRRAAPQHGAATRSSSPRCSRRTTPTCPETVRDAVLARAARLDADARAVLEAVAVEPTRAELWLLEALVEDVRAGLDACLASGMLRSERSTVGFRHEIARVVIEEALPPDRRALLARRALDALTAAIGRRARSCAPRPSRRGGRRRRGRAALCDRRGRARGGSRIAPRGGPAARARRALRGGAAERAARPTCSSASATSATSPTACSTRPRLTAPPSTSTARAATASARATAIAGSPGSRGSPATTARADAEAQLAIDLLQPLGPRKELAMAYSNLAQLRMLTLGHDGAVAWGNAGDRDGRGARRDRDPGPRAQQRGHGRDARG